MSATTVRGRTLALMTGALLGLVQASATSQGAAPWQPRAPNEARVEKLLAQMSVEEMLGLIHGGQEPAAEYQGQGGYLPGVPRLGVPSLRMADGPPGVLTREISGAPPATMALAATFSPDDAREIGTVVSRNARARGIDIVLEPYVNIMRDPAFGRAYNTYGEDPLLTGVIGAAFVRGVQEQGVMAQAKHFVAYEGGNDVSVGPQALHEIYLAPFEAVVRAGVSSIMCAYNKVNGPYACGNERLLNGVLRQQLGFEGFVTSDWGATHGAEFITAGLDMEMPGEPGGMLASVMTPYFVLRDAPPAKPIDMAAMLAMLPVPGGSPDFDDEGGGPLGGGMPKMETLAAGYSPTLKSALDAGRVTEDAIRTAARRVLAQIERFGYLDGMQKHTVTAEPIEQNAPVLRKVATDAAVLLANDGALPLADEDLADTVFIGPGALQNIAVGEAGEKALGWPERQIGVVEVLRRAGKPVKWYVGHDMAGVPIPADRYSSDGSPGLVRASKGGPNARDAQINFTVANRNALPPGDYTWTGILSVPSAGDYNLNLQVLGASAQVLLDGRPANSTGMLALHGDVLQAGQDNVLPTPDGLDNVRRGVKLAAGEHTLTVKVQSDTSGKPVQVRMAWVSPEQRAEDRAEALEAARRARKVVVFAWARGTPKKMRLAGSQDAFIEEVAAANPSTIVVLNTSSPVAMPWLGKVRAVLQMWYSGDEGGWATADLLMGNRSPAGRLPFTWPARGEDLLTNDPKHPEWKSTAEKTEYSEGIFVGYRWFDRQKLEPLFPFGHGLSYTRFTYSGLKVAKTVDGGLDVTFTLRNAGRRDGDEVAQVYLGAPDRAVLGVQFAERALAGFERVHLAAGAQREVKVHVPARSLQYWSPAESAWRTAPGRRTVSVGASSRDLRLTGAI